MKKILQVIGYVLAVMTLAVGSYSIYGFISLGWWAHAFVATIALLTMMTALLLSSLMQDE